MDVFTVTDIREWRGRDVLDASDKKLGTLEAIYVDTTTDEPAFATVRVGMPTRHRLAFVPLDGAQVGPEYLRVAWDKRQIKGAPSIDTDGELLATEEPAVFAHYEFAYRPGATGERRLARR
ncbi:photosystem reaction center subunit H [Streptomyces griseoaurantiacus]|uniref:PRC-barrel domain-containing protein n=2 Tax=Streptomyces griseoaurantiacus TaxID=68213 RepID=F3N9T0_9ACTN|nr:hypothetical protein SGM_0114 [Streptomyces griseoaurantiacus M045]GHE48136.1 photosystem reaction center subunit H [Streptomyces griseoaurantiacus]SDF92096.1 PRC-barrel domain-containing protein [Streptomyces jietaisiensis]